MSKIPRKKKKRIPKGVYCYDYVSPNYNYDGTYKGYKIKPCPFYKSIPRYDCGQCKLDGSEVMDMVKNCDFNIGKL